MKINTFIYKESKLEYKIMKAISEGIRYFGRYFNKARYILPYIFSLIFLYVFYYLQIGRYRDSWNALSPFSDMLFRKGYSTAMKILIVIIMIVISRLGSLLCSGILFVITFIYTRFRLHSDNAYDRMTNEDYKESKKSFMERYDKYVKSNSLDKDEYTPFMHAIEEYKHAQSTIFTCRPKVDEQS